jgi:hypothetical protein
MHTANLIPNAPARRAIKATLALLAPHLLLLPVATRTAFAAPPTISEPSVSALTATPAPAAAPVDSAPTTVLESPSPPPAATPPAAEPATEPSSTVAAPKSEPNSPTSHAAPAPAAKPPAATPPACPPAPAEHDEYDGPPLLVGDARKKVKVGGYGGPTVAYTHMLNRDGVLVGGEGAVLINHRLSFGGAGYGFTGTPEGPAANDGTPREFFTGYGGFLIRYAIYTNIPVYASFGMLVGGGGITLAPRTHTDDDTDTNNVETRGFFVLQPDVSLHANVTRWLRFGLTFAYRIAESVDDFDPIGEDMSGVVVGGNIQAGWF